MVKLPVDWESFRALLPDQSPEATQEAELVEDQDRETFEFQGTVMGPFEPFALMSTVGAEITTEQLSGGDEPFPLHVRVYV